MLAQVDRVYYVDTPPVGTDCNTDWEVPDLDAGDLFTEPSIEDEDVSRGLVSVVAIHDVEPILVWSHGEERAPDSKLGDGHLR